MISVRSCQNFCYPQLRLHHHVRSLVLFLTFPSLPQIPPMFGKYSIHHIILEAAGLVALADLSIVAVRTSLTGTASPLDVLLLAPGMHQQQSAEEEDSWKGAPGKGEGDLLILLSKDRWVRLRGSSHDIKTVTAGEWLRDQSTAESFFVALATLLVYAAAVMAGNASTMGSLLIACLLLCSAALLGLCNSWTGCLQMYDCIVRQEGISPRYARRSEMVHALILASGKDDWAYEMGLKPKHEKLEVSVGVELSSEEYSFPSPMPSRTDDQMAEALTWMR